MTTSENPHNEKASTSKIVLTIWENTNAVVKSDMDVSNAENFGVQRFLAELRFGKINFCASKRGKIETKSGELL
jgi:hypothetical protein